HSTPPSLERVADADRRLLHVLAAVRRARRPIVHSRGGAVAELRRDRVQERLAVEAVPRAQRPQVGREAAGAAIDATGQLARTAAGMDVLRRKAPRAEGDLVAERPVGFLVLLELARAGLAGLRIVQPRDVGHHALAG